MKKIFAVLAILAVSYSLPAMADTIQANCFYVGSSSLSKNALSNGSATTTDPAFEKKRGMIDLTGDDAIYYQGQDKIYLGYNYNLFLYVTYQKQEGAGDFVYPIQSLRGRGILKYKDQIVSSGYIKSDRVKTEYFDGTGKKFYEISFELENALLREKLGVTEKPELALMNLLQASNQKEQLFSILGDGDGLVTEASVHCRIPVIK